MMYEIMIGNFRFVRAIHNEKTFLAAKANHRETKIDGDFMVANGSPLYALPGGDIRSLKWIERKLKEKAHLVRDHSPYGDQSVMG